jgi:hypothetical protein
MNNDDIVRNIDDIINRDENYENKVVGRITTDSIALSRGNQLASTMLHQLLATPNKLLQEINVLKIPDPNMEALPREIHMKLPENVRLRQYQAFKSYLDHCRDSYVQNANWAHDNPIRYTITNKNKNHTPYKAIKNAFPDTEFNFSNKITHPHPEGGAARALLEAYIFNTLIMQELNIHPVIQRGGNHSRAVNAYPCYCLNKFNDVYDEERHLKDSIKARKKEYNPIMNPICYCGYKADVPKCNHLNNWLEMFPTAPIYVDIHSAYYHDIQVIDLVNHNFYKIYLTVNLFRSADGAYYVNKTNDYNEGIYNVCENTIKMRVNDDQGTKVYKHGHYNFLGENITMDNYGDRYKNIGNSVIKLTVIKTIKYDDNIEALMCISKIVTKYQKCKFDDVLGVVEIGKSTTISAEVSKVGELLYDKDKRMNFYTTIDENEKPVQLCVFKDTMLIRRKLNNVIPVYARVWTKTHKHMPIALFNHILSRMMVCLSRKGVQTSDRVAIFNYLTTHPITPVKPSDAQVIIKIAEEYAIDIYQDLDPAQINDGSSVKIEKSQRIVEMIMYIMIAYNYITQQMQWIGKYALNKIKMRTSEYIAHKISVICFRLTQLLTMILIAITAHSVWNFRPFIDASTGLTQKYDNVKQLYSNCSMLSDYQIRQYDRVMLLGVDRILATLTIEDDLLIGKAAYKCAALDLLFKGMRYKKEDTYIKRYELCASINKNVDCVTTMNKMINRHRQKSIEFNEDFAQGDTPFYNHTYNNKSEAYTGHDEAKRTKDMNIFQWLYDRLLNDYATEIMNGKINVINFVKLKELNKELYNIVFLAVYILCMMRYGNEYWEMFLGFVEIQLVSTVTTSVLSLLLTSERTYFYIACFFFTLYLITYRRRMSEINTIIGIVASALSLQIISSMKPGAQVSKVILQEASPMIISTICAVKKVLNVRSVMQQKRGEIMGENTLEIKYEDGTTEVKPSLGLINIGLKTEERRHCNKSGKPIIQSSPQLSGYENYDIMPRKKHACWYTVINATLRNLIRRARPNKERIAEFEAYCRDIAKPRWENMATNYIMDGHRPLTTQEWIDQVDTEKREEYQTAYDELRNGKQLTRKQLLSCKNHIKIDAKVLKGDTKDRNITAQNSYAKVIMGPIVEFATRINKQDSAYGSGYSWESRSKLFTDWVSNLLEPAQVTNDGSGYDTTQWGIIKEIVDSARYLFILDLYYDYYTDIPREYYKIVLTDQMQYVTNEKYKIKYEVEGTVGSGFMSTSDGNTMRSIEYVRFGLYGSNYVEGVHYRIQAQGDDTIIFTEKEFAQDIVKIIKSRVYTEEGTEGNLGQISKSFLIGTIEESNYLSTKMFMVNKEVRIVRDPARFLMSIGFTVNNNQVKDKKINAYNASSAISNAQSILAWAKGLRFYTAYASMLVKSAQGNGNMQIKEYDFMEQYRLSHQTEGNVEFEKFLFDQYSIDSDDLQEYYNICDNHNIGDQYTFYRSSLVDKLVAHESGVHSQIEVGKFDSENNYCYSDWLEDNIGIDDN